MKVTLQWALSLHINAFMCVTRDVEYKYHSLVFLHFLHHPFPLFSVPFFPFIETHFRAISKEGY
jgi:hypothetical protein